MFGVRDWSTVSYNRELLVVADGDLDGLLAGDLLLGVVELLEVRVLEGLLQRIRQKGGREERGGTRGRTSALMRLLGLNWRSFERMSSASSGALGNMEASERGWVSGSDSSMVAAKGELMASMSSAEGRPVISMMRSS